MLDNLKKEIHAKGFNISMLINKFKKDQRERKVLYEIPDEIYIAVCESIKGTLEVRKIDKPYPYFMHVLKLKSQEYFANKNQAEAKSQKFSKTAPEHLKGIMSRVCG